MLRILTDNIWPLYFEDFYQRDSKKVLTSLNTGHTMDIVNQRRKDNSMATPIQINKNTNRRRKDDGGMFAMLSLVHTILVGSAGIFLVTHAYGDTQAVTTLAGILLVGEALAIVVYHFAAAHK